MKLKLKESLFPPGGFKYTDPDGVVLSAPDLPKLVKVVDSYRVLRGQPPADSEQLILKQLCTRTPSLCLSNGPTFDGKTLALYVVHDIHQGARNSKLVTQSPENAASRLATCADCPNNVNWVKSCATCQKSVATLIPALVHPRPLLPASVNQACLVARDSLALAIYRTNPTALPTAPDGCWRKL